MNKKIYCLLFCVMLISCEKESLESNLLTTYKWILQDDSVVPKVTITFHENNTYITETSLKLFSPQGIPITVVPAYISGNWTCENNDILFSKRSISFPDSIDSISIDDISRESIKFVNYENYNNSGDSGSVVMGEDRNKEEIWNIKKLTKDSLIVVSNGEIIRYYH